MKFKIFCICSVTTLFSYSQNRPPIQADRPDQTETPAIVPRGMFQVEAGFSYQKKHGSNNLYTLPAALWKFGLNENCELRLITEFIAEKVNGTQSSGFTPILIGCKIKICNENGFIPKTSLIGHVSLPKIASSKYKADNYIPEFRFTMQHTITDRISLGYNLGSEWNGISPKTSFIYTLTTGYSITERFGSYIELFGSAPQDENLNHNLDGGFTFLINPDFMIDLSSGIGLNDEELEHYFALGISYRI